MSLLPTLSEEFTVALAARLQSLLTSRIASEEFTCYMQGRDKAYYREEMPIDKHGELESIRQKKLDEIIPPLVYSKVDSARAQLANIFLSPDSIFEVVSPPNLVVVANQYNAIYESDAKYFGWKSNISVAILDMLKYNVCAAEVTWCEERVIDDTDTGSNNSDESEDSEPKTKVIYEGNKIKRLDLYNTFWDMSVSPERVHLEGDYAGYIDLMTRIRFDKFARDLQLSDKLIDEIKNSIPQVALYQTPTVNSSPLHVSPEDEAADFFSDTLNKNVSSQSVYNRKTLERQTIYFRSTPKILGVKIPNRSPVAMAVFKAIVINCKYLVYLDIVADKHGKLPIVFGQGLNEGMGYNGKSFSQNLEDIQLIASMLVNAEIKSTRQVLKNRSIYNPLAFNSKHINTSSMTAAIPMKVSATGMDINSVYKPLPYSDPAMGTRFQQAAQISALYGDEISGQNQVTQGGFIKGNKTNDQFSASMAASGQRLFQIAINFEDSFMSALKSITLANILQYQPATKILSAASQQEIVINPTELRQLEAEFKVTDGLIPTDRVASTEMIMVAIQTIQSLPDLAMTYDVGKMFTHLMSMKGIKHLDQYQLTPEQQQQKLQQMQAATDAQTPTEPQQPNQ